MKKTSNFLNQFNIYEQSLLIEYFTVLNKRINLNKKDTKKFNEDFEKAILYYYRVKNYKIESILKILNLRNIKDFYLKNHENWYSLDYAAKVYPLSMKKDFMATFRISVYLKENVIPELLQIALTFTIKRFPTFATTIRKGFFWYYLEGIKRVFSIHQENECPCSKINISNLNKKTFKTLYFKNRISVEFFHVLTDGYGGTIFVKTLVGEYFKLLGKEVSYDNELFDINEEPKKSEMANDFLKFEPETKKENLNEKKALQLDGKLSIIKPCQVLHFNMNLTKLKKICKERNVTITNFLLALIFTACSYSISKNGFVNVQVPVNIRKYYNSKSVRNFSLYANISIKNTQLNNFDKLLEIIRIQMDEKINKEKMNNTMVYTSKLMNSIKFIPMFIKRPVTKLIYGFLGEKVNTTVLSNIGYVNYPDSIKNEIEKMDFVLGTTNINRILFGAISTNNILTLTVSKLTINKSVENNLYNMLKNYDIDLFLEGSEIYGN